MIGQTISHYKILEKLGEGGMGVVYKAQDTKLDRLVAVKFLPPHLAADANDKQRFINEAKAVSALDHPNVCTVYEIGETPEGQLFIAMAYYAGETLQQKMKPIGAIHESPLPLDDVLTYVSQIAEGLQAAHKKGITHRDIKSSNIMLTTEGHVKIMDFGLAKTTGATMLTKSGATVGTVPYMSPEQARGEKVDHRTDIWSLGVVLYEMIACRLPFQSPYSEAIVYSILNEEPKPFTLTRNDVPVEVENIVKKCLQKNSAERYQHVDELLIDLRQQKRDSGGGKKLTLPRLLPTNTFLRWALVGGAVVFLVAVLLLVLPLGSTRTATIDSIAVLPFMNVSGDLNTEYITDGVTAGLINRLSELSDLKVMSRHSVARFKDGSEDPRAAGRLLEVASVLTGQLDLRGERLVVDVELLDVEDGRQLWGDRFDRERKDLLTIEREIVGRISEKLSVRLAGKSATRSVEESAPVPAAYDLYLRGRYIMLGTSDDGPARAQEFFRRAIEREPRLAVAYAGLGESYVKQAWLSSKNRDDMVPLAKAALKKALELNPGLSETHVLAGDVALYFDWDWSVADASYRKAVDANPGNDVAHREYANYLLLLDRPDEAIAEARKAQSLDPLSVYATHQLGYCLLAAGRLPEAAAEFRKAIDLNPTWVWGNIKIGVTYALMGDSAKALAAMNRADELLAGGHGSPLAQSWLAEIAYLCGDPKRIQETKARLESQAKITYVEPVALASMYYRLGEYDRVHEYLQRGYELRSPLMVFLQLQRRFIWKKVADDPRYLKLIERMGFPKPAASR